MICDIVPFVTACARYGLLFDIGVQIKRVSGTVRSKAFAILLFWLFVHLNRAHRPVFFVALHMHVHKYIQTYIRTHAEYICKSLHRKCDIKSIVICFKYILNTDSSFLEHTKQAGFIFFLVVKLH